MTWVLIMWYGLAGSVGCVVVGHYSSLKTCEIVAAEIQTSVPGFRSEYEIHYCIKEQGD